MVNYISHENDAPLCEEYNQCLKLKINDTVYLTSILTAEAVSKNNNINEKALKMQFLNPCDLILLNAMCVMSFNCLIFTQYC